MPPASFPATAPPCLSGPPPTFSSLNLHAVPFTPANGTDMFMKAAPWTTHYTHFAADMVHCLPLYSLLRCRLPMLTAVPSIS